MSEVTDHITKKIKIIDAAYSSVMNTKDFDELIDAWDQTYLNEILSEKLLDGDLGLSLEGIEAHFSRALMMKPAFEVNEKVDFQRKVDQEILPSMVFDQKGHYLAQNNNAIASLFEVEMSSLSDLPFQNLPDLKAIFAEISQYNEKSQKLLQAYKNDGSSVLLHLSAFNYELGDDEKVAVMIRIIENIWTENIGNLLSSAFNLTDTEIETTRLLTLGHDANEISDLRNRSIETVRNQIRSVLAKTQAKGQVELVRILTLINQVSVTDEKPTSELDLGLEVAAKPLKNIVKIDGRDFEYARYGASTGPVLLYITTSSLPEETMQFRNLMKEAGIQVIAPYRPAFGGSEKAAHDNSLTGYVADCLLLIEQLEIEDLHIAGHREGGIFATQLAAKLGKRAKSLTIINTGAPVKDWKKLHQCSFVARRSLVTAIKAPKVLVTGYRLAAKIFASGSAGEEKILNVFYANSQIDLATYTEPSLREVTRKNIEFCFQNPDNIVADIAHWASDWSADLAQAAMNTDILFVHAKEHDFMLADWVKQACNDDSRLKHKIIKMAGQTMLYTHTRNVVELISKQIHKDISTT